MAIETNQNATYRRAVLLDGSFKGNNTLKEYKDFTESSVDGYFYTSPTFSNHGFSNDELFYIGIVSSHIMYPTKSWLSVNKSDNQCYSVTREYKTTSYNGITFRYFDNNGNYIIVTVNKGFFNNKQYKMAFKIHIDINKKDINIGKNSMKEVFKALSESEENILKAMKEYNEKMKKINKNLEQINKEKQEINKKKQN